MGDKFGGSGRAAAANLRQWLSGDIPLASPEILARHLDDAHLDLVFDAFWQVLPFGTGGRRGRVGYGANRLNPTTVAMTVEGHCQYLRNTFADRDDLAVVVANDVRVFRDLAGTYGFLGSSHPLLGVSSRSLAKLACEIYAGNGIVAYLKDPDDEEANLSTPELSFLIGKLGAVGGINLSASHNPPDDNGIKVYDQHGSQPVAPHDQQLIDTMSQATSPAMKPFAEAREEGLIRPIAESLHEEYLQANVELYNQLHKPVSEFQIVYTPLCGVGTSTVRDVLDRLGFSVVMPPDQLADGSFAAIPYRAPNPEVAEATVPATRYADEQGARIVFSTDPDADRIGVEIKLEDDTWYHFDGNQIAAVLCYYLMLDPQGPRRKGLVIETLVTTKLLSKIVEQAGDSWIVDNLLVGFKYVADVLKELEHHGRYGDIECRPSDLVLAAEESHGVLFLPTIRDKDAAPGCMFLAALYQRLAGQGRTLLDYYAEIIGRMGGYDNVNRSIMMSGAVGNENKARIMAALRARPPAQFAGFRVLDVVDYHDQDRFGRFVSDSDRLPRDVIQIFAESCVVTIRPSGTEPKLKVYCQLLPGEQSPEKTGRELLAALRTRANSVADLAYNELLSRMETSLGPAALRLPDIIDLSQKQRFENETIPALRSRLDQGAFADLDSLLHWMRSEVADMMPGADPLPALKAPVAYLCATWEDTSSLAAQLRAWAET